MLTVAYYVHSLPI